MRIVVAAGAALLAAWLIALALGVLGGFGSLPVLPHSQPSGSRETNSPAHATAGPASTRVARQEAVPVRTVAPSSASGTPSLTRPQTSTPGPSANTVTQQPSTSSSSSSSATSTQGQSAAHTTQTTGKPVGSPGNGSGGSGAPGQLR